MKRLAVAVAVAAALTSPSLASAAAKTLTPMELQAIQQKEFDAPKAAVFSSVMDVFQDLGYTVNSADVGTGFITAESATTNKTSFWDAMAEMQASGNTRATAFVETMPSGMTRVRLNFVSTKASSGNWGRNFRQDKPIQEPAPYQRAFEKIDEALFVRKSISGSPASPTPSGAPAVAPR